MTTVKLRTKMGGVEIDFEGDEGFLKTELSSFISGIMKTLADLPAGVAAKFANNSGEGAKSAEHGGAFDHSTNTIASITDAKTGPDLAMAAVAHLILVKGQDKVARKAILDEMQSATTFYNQNYSGNLSKILISLTKGKRLNLVGTHMYALTKSERDAFEVKLAQPA